MKRKNMSLIIAADNNEMGEIACEQVVEKLTYYTKELKKEVLIVFAAAPSQDTFLKRLATQEGIDWDLITAFHLDDYLDLPADHPNTFKTYLKDTIFSKVQIPEDNIHYIKDIQGPAGHVAEAYGTAFTEELARIKNAGGTYLAFIGIGVNGHIAFNEPHSDIYSNQAFLNVQLDEVSIQQQFDDYKDHPDPNARYASLGDVPRNALTLSCAGILAADTLYCMVPGSQKANAVKGLIEDPVGTELPATLLRLHHDIHVYIDQDSASHMTRPPELAMMSQTEGGYI